MKQTILIVEDDADTLALIEHYLKDSDFRIISSKNGDEAFQLTIDEAPDIALIDGLIPGIHGFELCKQIKESPKLTYRPKIIIMSSVYTGRKYKMEIMEYKADDFLPKPFDKAALLSKINAVMKAA
ncbi:MAG: response regulator transcription factor [Thermodesulfovibrionales bacterium]